MTDAALLLGLDTATRTPVLALCTRDGALLSERRWTSRHRHGEQLLQELDALLAAADATPAQLGGVGVGVGPGSFTGLRIGLATAKVLAHALQVPLIGVSTTQALALAAGETGDLAVTLPAGVADRYVHLLRVSDGTVEEVAPPRLVATPADWAEVIAGSTTVAVDIEAADVPAAAFALGERAIGRLAGAVGGLAARALAGGRSDDIATLVPAYVALPRGIARAAEEIRWSPDLR